MSNETKFICPVCKKPLLRKEKSLLCENGHNYDISKSGYVNLLLGSSRKNHGDNKLMTLSRRDFLSKGYYESLKNTICTVASEYLNNGDAVLDCGCGEGYYTAAFGEQFSGAKVLGTDISKDELSVAAKRTSSVSFAVASSFSLPIADESVDMLFEIFSPFCLDEFRRVIEPDGYLVVVFPLENHLWELKQAAYDTPYKNEVADTVIDGFSLVNRVDVKNKIDIKNAKDIQNLFKMTPYYYKTGKTEQQRVEKLKSLRVSTEFSILVYKKI